MRLLVALSLLVVAMAAPASAQPERFGIFTSTGTSPPSLLMEGAIGETAVIDFRRALYAHPDAIALVLNSEGGQMANALVIADLVNEAGLGTIVPADARCLGACAFIFFAGETRMVLGSLGVRQPASADGDIVVTETLLSSMLELLDRFGTPLQVVGRVLLTPPDGMYVFSAVEVVQLGINQGPRVNGSPLAAAPAATPTISLRTDADAGQAQAILYEEGAGGGTTAALAATITWRLVSDPAGPIIAATIEIPERHMSIAFSIQENHNPALAFSHEIDFLVTVDPNYPHPGGGVASIAQLAMKTTEDAVGEPLIGASHALAPDFFWIELDPAAENQNLNRLRSRDWFDLGIIYDNGLRAILTFEMGVEGRRVFNEALAAWAAN